MMREIIAASLLTVSISSGAGAQQILAAGALFAGPTQFRGVCYFYNAGSTNLQLSGAQISTPGGSPLVLAVNECGPSGSTLLPGRSCGIAANVLSNQSYNCKVVVSPGKGMARGVFEMRNSSQVSLTNVELR
jgi:hypothetical protein